MKNTKNADERIDNVCFIAVKIAGSILIITMALAASYGIISSIFTP